MHFTKEEILKELDLACEGLPGKYFPEGEEGDIKYNFFLDLEHGYWATAGSRIHLYADSTRWAIVFEKSGYNNRGYYGGIELDYIGNCVDYSVMKYPERSYITNSINVVLITAKEFQRIENKEGKELEIFELISQHIQEINVRDTLVLIDNDHKKYKNAGVAVRDYANPMKLVGFEDLIRYLHETTPKLISATEVEIGQHIPKDLPKLMTIDEFHFMSGFTASNPPSQQETYKLIAKVLLTGDTTKWKPTLKPNNSWKNWESGNL